MRRADFSSRQLFSGFTRMQMNSWIEAQGWKQRTRFVIGFVAQASSQRGHRSLCRLSRSGSKRVAPSQSPAQCRELFLFFRMTRVRVSEFPALIWVGGGFFGRIRRRGLD